MMVRPTTTTTAATTANSSSSSSSSSSKRYDVYDIDGTLTRPGYDIWYLTSKELCIDPIKFDERIKQWKYEMAQQGGSGSGSDGGGSDNDDIVKASERMMIETIQNYIRKDVTSDIVEETAYKICTKLIQDGLVYSEWISYVKKRLLVDNIIPILATTNYIEGGKAFVRALVNSNYNSSSSGGCGKGEGEEGEGNGSSSSSSSSWLTKEEAEQFIISGTCVDWNTESSPSCPCPPQLVHFNMHQNKVIGISQVTGLSISDLQNNVDNVFGDDPIGNDMGILNLVVTSPHHTTSTRGSGPSKNNSDNNNNNTTHKTKNTNTTTNSHAYVVHTKKNSKLTLPNGMQRMSWLHWTDEEKHRIPIGLMGMFGQPPHQQQFNTLSSLSSSSKAPTVSPPPPPRLDDEEEEERQHRQSILSSTMDDDAAVAGAASSEPATARKGVVRVVIVGGGFCGVIVARCLLQNKDLPDDNDGVSLSVTLIDPKDSFEYVGALPKSFVHDDHVSACVPYKDALPNTRVIKGWVNAVLPDHVLVTVGSSGSSSSGGHQKRPTKQCRVDFDHLVIATGSTYPAAIKYSHVTALSGVTRMAELDRQRSKVCSAKSLLIIGGGYVGCEIATEIASVYPDKIVTMVDRHPRLLPRTPSAHPMLMKRLEELGIRVILGETVIQVDPETLDYMTESGKRLQCDHAIWCGGPQPNSTLVKSIADAFPLSREANAITGAPAASSSQRGCLVVNQNLNVVGSDGRVWCGGDACIVGEGCGEEAMAARAMKQGRVIATNIVSAIKQGISRRYDPNCGSKRSREAIRDGTCLEKYEHGEADIASMIVSLGDKRAMVVISDELIEGPFRCLKEEIEQILLSQIHTQASDSLGHRNTSVDIVDPYTLLNNASVEKLRQHSTQGKEPTLADILNPEDRRTLDVLRSRFPTSSRE